MSGSLAWPVAHAIGSTGSIGENAALLTILTVGGVISVGLLALGTLALRRRRSRSYMLVTVALGALTIKAVLGGLWMFHLVSGTEHHLLEHGMDLVIAVLLVAAVYVARTNPGPEPGASASTEEAR